ncbi:MAG: KDO2-lipid IV(A) lauroyltransferase [Candidatus Midichloriaceae bacterium]|jgi:KDO2-lipid IV(A) lauroyltransferase
MKRYKLRYLFEGIIVYAIYYFFKTIPIKKASIIAGKLVQKISFIFNRKKLMRKNIKLCLPNTTEGRVNDIISLTWYHFGSILGELPHWQGMKKSEFFKNIEIINPENIPQKKAILISGHIGNWELISRIAQEFSINLSLVYRPSNNPYANKLINGIRESYGVNLIAKGKAGVKQILNDIKEEKVVGMMVDQKYNEGIAIPFFGKKAMTTILPAKIALKHGIPIVMVRVIKVQHLKYKVEFMKPLDVDKNDEKESVMLKVNNILERWIKETPEQWFWFHNRWK